MYEQINKLKVNRSRTSSSSIQRSMRKENINTKALREKGSFPSITQRLSKEDVKVSLKGEGSLFTNGMKLSAFTNTALGEEHFIKHGAEFNEVDTKQQYIKKAQSFGNQISKEYVEATINNTNIRFDPNNNFMLIASGKKILTFYVWNPIFSKDPVAYAIYYTITHNQRTPIRELPEDILVKLKDKGIDLFSTERDFVDAELRKGISIDKIMDLSGAPFEFIIERDFIRDKKYGDMRRALYKENNEGERLIYEGNNINLTEPNEDFYKDAKEFLENV